MKKTIILIFLTIITLGLVQPAAVLAEEIKLPSGTERSQIGQKIEDYVKEHEKTTAGMGTAVFDKEGTIYRGNFGYMDKEKGIEADDDSVFEWGSVTKLTVWVSVMQLWEEGRIDLEEDIRTYLPKGFLRNLRYDKPITMLDLMNHQPGFDEAPLYMKTDRSLEELLRDYQPIQSFEPGTTTAYSNYGTALAAYIVEQVSGQSFADYVHDHIFKPLHMDRTAILPDLSDNEYVQKKRKEDKGYDTEGKLLGDVPFEVGLYPAGRATGTLGDMQKFAQALLSRQTLFQRSETWNTLYTKTSTYADGSTARVAHGFWAEHYGVTLLGHGGNTDGFSSYLLLDLENGIGQVVMTNQAGEEVYNTYMPELVFGKHKTASKETQDKFQPGYYKSLRNLNTGPMSVMEMLPGVIQNLSKISDEPTLPTYFWSIQENQGDSRIQVYVHDLQKISKTDVFKSYFIGILGLLAIAFTLGSILIRSIIAVIRLVFRKAQSSIPRSWKIWHGLTTLGIVLAGVNAFMLFLAFMTADYSMVHSWRYMLFAGLGLILAVCGLYPFFSKAMKELTKGRLFLTVLTSLSALSIVANILYWSLYQWWVL